MREGKSRRDLLKSNNLPMLGYSAIIGVAAGVVASLYRLLLTYMENFSISVYGFIARHAIYILPAFVILAVMGYFIGILLKKYKLIGGSGIPQVKGILMGYFKASWLGTLIAKIVGGAVSMLAGLSLGREGPSIQIGASVAQGIGDKLVKNDSDKRILIASGASAGLSAAFNAPLSGVVFTLEEVFRYFSPLILLTTMVAAVIADAISRLMLGSGSIFHFTITGSIPISKYWILILMGLVLGLFGAVYNNVLLWSVKLFKRIKDQKYRPVLAFLAAGVFGLLFPAAICGGHSVVDGLSVSSGIGFLCAVFLLKFLFSMISYGSGAPGGIFFPLLVMGGVVGAIFAQISIAFFGLDQSLFANLVILAMAGFFTAIVRAPITGIVLLVEMTGSFSHLMPLTVVALVAFITADTLKSEPIYDSLLRNMLGGDDMREEEEIHKITVETIVHFDSPIDKMYVRELKLPEDCLLVSVKRRNRELIPNGDTQIMAGDYLVFLVNSAYETQLRELLGKLTTSR